MRLSWRLIVAIMLVAGVVPGAVGAEVPRVQVIAEFQGNVFEEIPEPDRKDLKREIQDRVKEAAEKIHPCMKWVAEPDKQTPNAGAQLHVALLKKTKNSFWQIYLSFTGVVDRNPPHFIWEIDTELSPLRWHPRERAFWDEQRAQILRKITWSFEEGNRQELSQKLDREFISQLPIAHDIQPDPDSETIIVPVDARRLNLEPGTWLDLFLRASLCDQILRGYTIGLRTDGNFQDQLRCNNERLSRCPNLKWKSFAERLNTRERSSVKVFIAKDHRHCSYGPDHCSGPHDLYQHP